jgi:hypothetical protein
MCGRYDMSETPAKLGGRYRVDSGSLEFAPNPAMAKLLRELVAGGSAEQLRGRAACVLERIGPQPHV